MSFLYSNYTKTGSFADENLHRHTQEKKLIMCKHAQTGGKKEKKR